MADGMMTLELVSMRPLRSCFEIRSGHDMSQRVAPSHLKRAVTDGQYPCTCINNITQRRTVVATDYVEVRLAFSAATREQSRLDAVRPRP